MAVVTRVVHTGNNEEYQAAAVSRSRPAQTSCPAAAHPHARNALTHNAGSKPMSRDRRTTHMEPKLMQPRLAHARLPQWSVAIARPALQPAHYACRALHIASHRTAPQH